jgi:hypothetical protein
MTVKFGEFKWNCYKDVIPSQGVFLYFFDSGDIIGNISIGCAHEYAWEDDCYWCYVYMPDAPVIEKKLTLEERVDLLEGHFGNMKKGLR